MRKSVKTVVWFDMPSELKLLEEFVESIDPDAWTCESYATQVILTRDESSIVDSVEEILNGCNN